MRDCATSVDRNQHPMTRSSYARVADGICYATRAAFNLLPKPDDLSSFGKQIDQLEPVFEETDRDLHAIPAPDGDAAQLAAWLRVRDLTSTEVQRMRDAADSGDLETFSRLSRRLIADGRRAEAIATAYGMTVCGGPTA
jgi:hypothetical protein